MDVHVLLSAQLTRAIDCFHFSHFCVSPPPGSFWILLYSKVYLWRFFLSSICSPAFYLACKRKCFLCYQAGDYPAKITTIASNIVCGGA